VATDQTAVVLMTMVKTNQTGDTGEDWSYRCSTDDTGGDWPDRCSTDDTGDGWPEMCSTDDTGGDWPDSVVLMTLVETDQTAVF